MPARPGIGDIAAAGYNDVELLGSMNNFGMPPARLTNYVLAHSRYSSGLDQRGVLADLLIEADEQAPAPAVNQAAAHVQAAHVAP